jgi:hypothetical protein
LESAAAASAESHLSHRLDPVPHENCREHDEDDHRRIQGAPYTLDEHPAEQREDDGQNNAFGAHVPAVRAKHDADDHQAERDLEIWMPWDGDHEGE